MHARSWESTRDAFEWHEAKPSASLASRVLSQLPKRIHNSITVAHKGHHCIRMFYLTFRVLYLQFACSICSSHVLFSIPRAPFAARVLYLQFACSICSSRVLFSFCAFFCARVFFCCSRARQGNPRTLFLLARFCARDFVAADLYGLLETTWRLT